MKKVIDYLMNIINTKDKKKLIESAVIIAAIGIIVIIAGGTLLGNGKDKKTVPSNDVQKETAEVLGKKIDSGDKEKVEKDIQEILSKISGAGKVDVMITYLSGNEIVPAYDSKETNNSTEEKDNTGGTRNIKQNNNENAVAYEESQGAKKPIVLKELLPQVKGVVVVADGAGDPVVKEKLCQAVQVLMDVPVHKVQIFEKGK